MKETVLGCLVDLCPKVDKAVDMRRCCGTGFRKACSHYAREPWSEMGVITCTHPGASTSSERERRDRMGVFRACAGTAHITHCGPLR